MKMGELEIGFFVKGANSPVTSQRLGSGRVETLTGMPPSVFTFDALCQGQTRTNVSAAKITAIAILGPKDPACGMTLIPTDRPQLLTTKIKETSLYLRFFAVQA
jgi:hypothetical protein